MKPVINISSKIIFNGYDNIGLSYKKCPMCQHNSTVAYKTQQYLSAFCNNCKLQYQMWLCPLMSPDSEYSNIDILINIQLSNYIIKLLYSKYFNGINVYENSDRAQINFFSNAHQDCLLKFHLNSFDEFIEQAKNIVVLKSKIDKLLVLK